MAPQAYVQLISHDTEKFTYLDTSIPDGYTGSIYKLGDNILNMLDLNLDILNFEYINLSNNLIEPSLNKDCDALEKIRLQFNKLDERYPMLWFHTHLMYAWFSYVFVNDNFSIRDDIISFSGKKSDRIIYESGLNKLENDTVKSEGLLIRYFECVVKILLEDISYWKEAVGKAVAIILKYSGIDFYKILTPEQRLYFLDSIEDSIAHPSPFKFTDYKFTTQMMLGDITGGVISIEPKLRAEKIVRQRIGLNEMYVLNSTKDYLHFELIKFILSDSPISKCLNCGRIFIPRGRPDVKYCNRIAEGETLPCDEIGALRVYQHKVAEDPIFKVYNKAYKRMNSRVKYQKITQQEFFVWSEKARVMREKCTQGELSLGEFNEWLGNKLLKP